MLQTLAQLQVQHIFITATLPVRMESKFLNVVGLLGQDPLVIRDKTFRPELAHHVLKMGPDPLALPSRKAMDVTVDLTLGLQAQGLLSVEERMIIFVMSIEEGNALSQCLNCPWSPRYS